MGNAAMAPVGAGVGAVAGGMAGGPLGAAVGMQAGAALGGGVAEAGTLKAESKYFSQSAATELAKGKELYRRELLKGKQLMGGQIARYGNAGVISGQGSSANVMRRTAGYSYLGAMDALRNAQLEAAGLKFKSTLSNISATNALVGGVTQAAGDVVTGYALGAFKPKTTNLGEFAPEQALTPGSYSNILRSAF